MHIFVVLGLVVFFLIINLYLGFIIYICFDYAFYSRAYKDQQLLDFLPAEWFIVVTGILYALFFWVFKRIFPEKVYIAIFRFAAFLFGLILIVILVLFWAIAIKILLP